jgi:hypothetical protein
MINSSLESSNQDELNGDKIIFLGVIEYELYKIFNILLNISLTIIER